MVNAPECQPRGRGFDSHSGNSSPSRRRRRRPIASRENVVIIDLTGDTSDEEGPTPKVLKYHEEVDPPGR